MTYEISDDKGQIISTHRNYDEALDGAQAWAGEHAVVGHDGDLSEYGDRTLIWADEDAAENDAGANAMGSIRRNVNS